MHIQKGAEFINRKIIKRFWHLSGCDGYFRRMPKMVFQR